MININAKTKYSYLQMTTVRSHCPNAITELLKPVKESDKDLDFMKDEVNN